MYHAHCLRNENLILLMMVSNGLSFTFLKNKETQEVFRFIAPALKLPGRHAISNRILSKSAKQLTQSIVEQAKADVIGVTAAFNGWTNVKQEHLFGVVFITSSGKTLIWGRQLRIEYPSKVFLPCMAHQMNLVVDSRKVEPYDFEVGGHDTHPVPLAKCKLLELFNDSLEASIYMI
ncbi:hypothetical protein RhiirC2_719120 [Rhizophagus irregularis]|uniref:DUF659 domain-containing protein n=1 Tax=Rhizophagus irregularis TaxID=588596 RepID=A0A2N1MFK2_9GLOM|nr:hypothetical protein RhiirC2_719120 [Rhizophagus irregularis]